jgi:hypothetical protein
MSFFFSNCCKATQNTRYIRRKRRLLTSQSKYYGAFCRFDKLLSSMSNVFLKSTQGMEEQDMYEAPIEKEGIPSCLLTIVLISTEHAQY